MHCFGEQVAALHAHVVVGAVAAERGAAGILLDRRTGSEGNLTLADLTTVAI